MLLKNFGHQYYSKKFYNVNEFFHGDFVNFKNKNNFKNKICTQEQIDEIWNKVKDFYYCKMQEQFIYFTRAIINKKVICWKAPNSKIKYDNKTTKCTYEDFLNYFNFKIIEEERNEN